MPKIITDPRERKAPLSFSCSMQTLELIEYCSRILHVNRSELIEAAVQLYYNTIQQSEPVRKWIPVTERLPEVGKEVLIYAVGKDGDFSSVIAITERMIFRLFPSSDGVETWSSPWEYFTTNYEITHWMPLPDPPIQEEDLYDKD